MTTSQKFFSQERRTQPIPWTKVRSSAATKGGVLKRGPVTDGFQWAGEFHPLRKDFHKGKDHVSNWTNVCFRP